MLTGHEGLNSEDKDENGKIINPRISIEVQPAIHNNLVTQFDIIGHTFIEDHTDAERKCDTRLCIFCRTF
ncbi:hypothetical protein ACVPOR_09505 [Staphylococcus aureus]